ncbi:MAG: endopeptidase La [Deltaproteobacteria bacterium]|nr:endopeptidase La [Deltaproteobacteria bacterium]MBW2136898.1 endopeptidase La [Deltaproteobacteria bacterium]
MLHLFKTDEIEKHLENMPEELSILPLRNTVAYPFAVIPLAVGVPRSIRLVEEALQADKPIGLVAMKDPSIDEPQPGEVYETGTVAKILRPVMTSSENTLQVLVQGLERFRVERWLSTDSYLKAKIGLSPDTVEKGLELDALKHSLLELAREVITLMPNLPDEVNDFLRKVEDPRYLVYLVASNARLEISEAQNILEMDNIKDKFRALISHLTKEKELLTLGKKIQSEAMEKMDKAHREHYLRQQLKAIRKELGETEEGESEVREYEKKIEEARLPEEAEEEAKRELKRLKGMSPQSAEYSLIKTYLDWLLDLPWNVLSEDQLDINHARSILDEDHYDLQDVKDRIIEYLAVRKLVEDRGLKEEGALKRASGETMGAILCFVGPPGVGKTSLGESIARALGRRFTRMSLGGIRDEAEIRGHRRTYIGAMPGRIIQAIKRVGTRNPVFMLDEIDKVGNDWRGDPSSALLEVLDPAQNHAFRDHYLDVDFDLSDVMFITTANQLETIPPPLRDRMEIIALDGYTEQEKIKIARHYLVPRQIKVNGLRADEISFQEDAIRKIIQNYTREAGVRNLEREIGAICRKIAVKVAAGELRGVQVTPEIVADCLKKEKFEHDSSEAFDIPGIATGLAVTAVGGDILFIEATRMKGKGDLTLTGQLGDVMRESAQIAMSYVHSKARQFDIDPELFENNKVHLHVPAGAIPKDGPSAGIAMVMAIISLFSNRPVRNDVGMTGEVTLRGRVLPVGGIKMKVLAAHRAGISTVILPRRNERDLDDLPDDVRKEMNFVLIERIEEAIDLALMPAGKKQLKIMKQ